MVTEILIILQVMVIILDLRGSSRVLQVRLLGHTMLRRRGVVLLPYHPPIRLRLLHIYCVAALSNSVEHLLV